MSILLVLENKRIEISFNNYLDKEFIKTCPQNYMNGLMIDGLFH